MPARVNGCSPEEGSALMRSLLLATIGRGRRRTRKPLSLVLALGLATIVGALGMAPAALASEEGCPNEAIRAGQNATGLSECRAWELVTPAAKDNIEPRVFAGDEVQSNSGFMASIGGERMAWVAEEVAPPAKEVTGPETVGTEYLATRGPDGWSSEDVIPKQSVENGLLCNYTNTGVAGYTPDLSKMILADGGAQDGKKVGAVGGQYCGHNEPSLVPGESEGFQNLFVRDDSLLSYQLVDRTPGGVAPENAWFDAGSADFSHVVFNENAPLTKDSPSRLFLSSQGTPEPKWNDLYEWSGGTVRLVSYLPDGTAVNGTLPWTTWTEGADPIGIGTPSDETSEHPSASQSTHTVSADGSRIFFQAEGNLYVREDGTTTVQVDSSQGAGPGGGGKFMAATPDGSKVFFTDEASAGLTASTMVGSGMNLYEYEVPVQDGEAGTLTDLTAGSDARVLGLTTASNDGSYVYFVAEGALASGATAGKPNLYVVHGGEMTFIATLGGGDVCDWDVHCPGFDSASFFGLTARVSPNGRYLGFTSSESLTGYDNSPVEPLACDRERSNGSHESCREVYLYDAGANKLSCASCNPTGAPPIGNAFIRTPTTPSISSAFTQTVLSRNVTDSGQVFFDTPDALVPHDNNGVEDVYMYKEGHARLISSGTQAGPSYFLDASENGSNVFFTTLSQLVRRDTDQSYDLYDARVDGGFPEQGYQSACGDEGCRGLASNPPVLSLPDSASLISSGNVTPVPVVKPKAKAKSKPAKCKKAYVRRKGRCVRQRVGKSNGHSKKGKK